MQLCATLTKDDIASLIEQLTPLQVTLRPGNVVSFGRPSEVELVPGAGLRIRGDARFTWDVHGLTLPVTVRTWQVLLVPSFVPRAESGGHVLAFNPILEALDFKSVPMFLDGRLAEVIGNALASQKDKLAWDFASHLSIARALPGKVAPGALVSLGPTGGHVVVTAHEVRLTLDFEMRLQRESQRPAPAESQRTAPTESQRTAPSQRGSVAERSATSSR